MGPELELQGTCRLEPSAEPTESNDNVNDGGKKVEEGENLVVDVIDCSEANDVGLVDEAAERDTTENSSSFGGTWSGTENGATLSDDEVSSQGMVVGADGLYWSGYPDESQGRKKKLTDHWRKFIHPWRWPCKWLEIQRMELKRRADEYDKLAECERRKYCAFDSMSPEGFSSKSLAFSGQIQRNNVLKRKKRRKIEATVDRVSYFSEHNLFSHFTKKSAADKGLAKDGNEEKKSTAEKGLDDTAALGSEIDRLNFGVGSDTLLEQILAKIYAAKSEAQKLRTRIDKVISENPAKFSSINRLTVGMQSTAEASSDHDPSSPIAQLQSDGDVVRDLLLGGDASNHRGIAAALPDVRESTNQSDDGILINNLAVKEELLTIEKVEPENENHKVEENQTAEKVPEAALPRPPLKTYVSKRRRKRRPLTGRKKSKKS